MRKRSKSGLQRKVLVSLVCGSALMFYVGTGVALAAEEPSHEIIVNDKNIVDWNAHDVDATIKTTETGHSGQLSPSYTGNKVTINFTDTNKSMGRVDGAKNSDEDQKIDVTDNQVKISGGRINSDVYGGYTKNGNAASNIVEISGGTIDRMVYGGKTDKGDVSGNRVTIDNNATIADMVYGGHTNIGNAVANTLIIKGGSTASVFGAHASDGATVNSVSIEGGKIKGDVNAAFAVENNASGNMAYISGGEITGSVSGGATERGNAEKNIVTVVAGTIEKNIVGAYTTGGTVNGNQVNISGGEIKGNVYGGYAATMGSSAEAAVINNTVNLLAGDYTFGAETVIAGSGIWGNITGDFFTGNTLNVYRSDIAVKGVENFAKYNFYLPTTLGAGSTLLTVKNDVDLSKSTIGVGVQAGGDSALQIGDKVNLITTEGTLTTGDLTNHLEGMEGISRKYTFGLATADKTLTAELLKIGMAEQTKSLVETRLAASALINKGGDMLADQGLASAKAAAEQGSYNVFATAGGDSMRYNTGSHVDSKSYHLQGGFARTLASGTGTLTIAPLIEYGNGSYDSYLNDGVHASGDMHYWGLGFLARQDNADGFYYEGSVRGGKVGSDYKSKDLVGADEVTYDVSVPYYALHLGVGKVQTLSEQNTLDYYGKYFYSHQGGDSAALSSGEVYDFESVNSNRVRLGTRFTHQANALSKLYAGVAWEYEFSGSAEASYQGDKTLSPSLKGASGMLELGWQGKASSTSAMTADIAVTGWTGQQKGVAFKAGLNWAF